jgi:hypothetical protein
MECCFIYIYYRPCWSSLHCWIPFLTTMYARLRFWNSQVHIQSQGRIQSANAVMTSEDLCDGQTSPVCCSGKSVYCFVRKFSSSRWYSDMLTILWIIQRFIKFTPGILCFVILHDVLVAVVFQPANTVYWRLWTAVTKRASGCIFCWVFLIGAVSESDYLA